MFDRDEFRGMRRTFGWLAALSLICNLVFWLALIYGAFRIAQHFGVL